MFLHKLAAISLNDVHLPIQKLKVVELQDLSFSIMKNLSLVLSNLVYWYILPILIANIHSAVLSCRQLSSSVLVDVGYEAIYRSEHLKYLCEMTVREQLCCYAH